MKKEQTFRIAWHKRPLRLLFIIALLLIGVQCDSWARYNLPVASSPASQLKFLMPYSSLPLRPVSKNKALEDVTLLFSNYYPADFDITLYNTATDEYYYLNVSPYQTEKPFTVPAGVYDINFWPNDMSRYYHFYSIGCGTTGGGIGSYNFYGVNITTEAYCNYVYID